MRKKKVQDVLGPSDTWTNFAWGAVRPDVPNAVIREVTLHGEELTVNIESDGNTFSSIFHVADSIDRQNIYSALSRLKGSTVRNADDVEIG